MFKGKKERKKERRGDQSSGSDLKKLVEKGAAHGIWKGFVVG